MKASDHEVHNAVQSLRELEALAKDGKLGCHAAVITQEDTHGLPTNTCNGEAVEELPNKAFKTSKQPTAAGLRHIATEQRRRDRINEGFDALRELLPRNDKMDKATFLRTAVDYIKNLQDTLQAVIESGALSHLDTDQQWSLRMLLPRRGALTAGAPAAGTGQGPAVILPAQQQQQAAPAVPPNSKDQTLALFAAMLTTPAHRAQAPNDCLMQLVLAATEQLQHPSCQASNPGEPFLTGPSINAPAPGLLDPAPAGGYCNCAPLFQVIPVPKARKSVKVRRHTTASRIDKPALPHAAAPAFDAGRPAQAEFAA